METNSITGYLFHFINDMSIFVTDRHNNYVYSLCFGIVLLLVYCPFNLYKPLQFNSIGALTMFRGTIPFVLLGVILQLAIGQSINLCPPCICEDTAICVEEERNDPCSCCKRCNKQVGETCSDGDEGICRDGLLCLPNDPYSSSSSGTCFGMAL